MKILHKLKAFFFKNEQPVALDLSAAEIRGGRAYLHPKGNRQVTYLVRSNDIEIHLNRNKELSDDNIVVVEQKESSVDKNNSLDKTKQFVPNNKPASGNFEDAYGRFRKKTFSVTLYQHEYDALMNTIKEYGYKRAEFIMASANTATRGTMEREHKKLVKVHKELRRQEKSVKANQKTS